MEDKNPTQEFFKKKSKKQIKIEIVQNFSKIQEENQDSNDEPENDEKDDDAPKKEAKKILAKEQIKEDMK